MHAVRYVPHSIMIDDFTMQAKRDSPVDPPGRTWLRAVWPLGPLIVSAPCINAPSAARQQIYQSDKGSLLCPGHPACTYLRTGYVGWCSSDPVDFTLSLFPFSFYAFSHDFLVMRPTAALFTLSALVSSALGATYPLKDKFVGQDFLSGFCHEAIADPTHGRV